MLPWQHLLNRGRINSVKNVIKPLYFYLYGKIDMKSEISVSELTPPPNFSLIPLKIQTMEIRRGGSGIHPPYLVSFSDPKPFRVNDLYAWAACKGQNSKE